ncbi:unnamed protein product [Thlaspi arvense]|uniref:Protein CPR-5 n=1 Tax=Thlaspi arvense TaxID=13288 RepID=A0AAU9SIH9_THLAR|nr:unnamed protein product [Thlaspi arvense]
MDALLISPSREPQKPVTDPAANHQPETLRDELKDDMMKKKINSSTLERRKLKAKKKEMMNSEEASSSCSSSSTTKPNYSRRVSRVYQIFRKPTLRLGMPRRSVGERQAEALALPLGMSLAAFTNLVLKKSAASGQNVYVNDLAVISASIVKESLANVYGYKLGSFETNFKRSFKSTLKILNLDKEYASPHQLNKSDVERFSLDRSSTEGCSDTEETSSVTSDYEAIQGGARTGSSMNEIVLHEGTRQLFAVPRRSSAMSSTPMEQLLARANDLETIKIGLEMEKLTVSKKKLAVSYESNNLKRAELEMGASKAAFSEDKFKTELEDTKKDGFVRETMEWLVVSVFIMLGFMLYGASVFSQQKIKEATSICQPYEEESSHWFVPTQVSWLNTELTILFCRLGVWAKYSSGVFMIIIFTYFIIQPSSSGTKQTTVTFIVLFLGFLFGLAGKFTVDTLGGNGKLWLYLWETFCILQLVAVVFTLATYRLIYGPITVAQGSRRCYPKVPYWARRSFFFGMIRFVLPSITGLLAFATFGEWRDHLLGGPSSEV